MFIAEKNKTTPRVLEIVKATFERFNGYITGIETNDEDFRLQVWKKYINLLDSTILDSFAFVLHSFIRLQNIYRPNMFLKMPPVGGNTVQTSDYHSKDSNTPYYKIIVLDDAFIEFCSDEYIRKNIEDILTFLEGEKITIFNFGSKISDIRKLVPENFKRNLLAVPSVKVFACAFIKKSGNVPLLGRFLQSYLTGFLEINCAMKGGRRARIVRKTRKTRKTRKSRKAKRVSRI